MKLLGDFIPLPLWNRIQTDVISKKYTFNTRYLSIPPDGTLVKPFFFIPLSYFLFLVVLSNYCLWL
ncbi:MULTISPECIES: DUF3955 domain-containing protein [Peribacillus]|uniref:DUF3955 domain-containing protein n=1 Tax=Peribacillus TaxID=2675229 RepID=UPI00366C98C9